MTMRFTFKNVKISLDQMNKKNKKFLQAIFISWKLNSNLLLKKVISDNYSGRPGLMKKSGNASRAIKTTTIRKGFNVITRFFIDPNNPARVYIPIHDKIRRSRIIRATSSKFLTYKLPDGTWRKSKSVFIPQRTDVFGQITRGGKLFRREGIRAALRALK